MKITGIICEYNPLHLGHQRQLDLIRQKTPDGAIACLMSGNYVQRGHPAVFDKLTRAKAALLCGADLVLELPLTAALSSAEGFASTGVKILGGFCEELSFGAETADSEALLRTARSLLSPEFTGNLLRELESGISFPAARQAALEAMGIGNELLNAPNNILAVEYCKAIISQKCNMHPQPIQRNGSYHALEADGTEPSATAIRELMRAGKDWQDFVPLQAVPCFADAAPHALEWGEKAILAKLRTMSDEAFEALPYGSEGLWRKLMHASREKATLEDILTAVKSKRYTRTRLDRMVMCAFLGITKEDLSSPVPYTRVLALNDKGREVLKNARQTGEFINIGTRTGHEYEALEHRAGSLYGLFAKEVALPTPEQDYRVFYHCE